MIKQSQSQNQIQKLLPSIILNQKILSIPTLALENIIKRELELNPMLEETAENENEDSENNENEDNNENDEEVNQDKDEITELKSEDNETEVKTDEEIITDQTTNEENDWDEYFDNEADNYQTYETNDAVKYDNQNLKEESSLTESLILQIHLSGLSKKLIFTADEIIWSLTDDGYFTNNYEDIIEDLNAKKTGTEFENETFTTEDIKECVKYMQETLDPAGIAARNLTECLLIQTSRSAKPGYIKELATKIIENHLDDLRLKRFENVSRDLNIELSLVSEVFDFIHKLNPKPGFNFNSDSENYIVPDLIVKKIDDMYEIYLNERFTPGVRINKTYQNLYSNRPKSMDKETKEYLISNFNKAKWFIDAINSRKETMLKVMNAIVVSQKKFFDNNGEGLLPLFEKDVATEIKMDHSTISRTVRGKYVQTDFGIYELRSFFTTPIHTSGSGTDVSNQEVKIKLKEIIEKENKSKPLSDEELSEELKKIGYRIARRTVAKYREAINLPIAKLRREIKL